MKARRILFGCAMLAPSLACAQTQQPSQSQPPQKTQQVTNCRALDSAGGFVASDEVLVDGMVCKLAKPKKVVFVPEVPQGSSGNSTFTPGAKTVEVAAPTGTAGATGGVAPTAGSGSLAEVARSYGKTSKILVAPSGKTELPTVRPGASMGEIARAYRGSPEPPANEVPEQVAAAANDGMPAKKISVAEAARAYGKASQGVAASNGGDSGAAETVQPEVRSGASVAEIARAYKKSNQPQLMTSKGSAASRLLTKPEREKAAERAAPVGAAFAVANAQPAAAANAAVAKSEWQAVVEVAPEPVQAGEVPPKPVLKTEFARPKAKAAKRVTASAPSIGVAGQNASNGLTSVAASSAIGSPGPSTAEQVQPAEGGTAEAATSPVTGKNETVPKVALSPAPAPVAVTQPRVNAGTFSQPDASADATEKAVAEGAMPAPVGNSAEARPEVQTGNFGTPDTPVVEAKPEKPIDPFEQGQSLDDLRGGAPHPGCSKIVSLGRLEKDRLILAIPTWALQWAVKNQKKFPGICLADAPVQGLRSFLIVFYSAPAQMAGVSAANSPSALETVLQKPSGRTFSTTFGSTWHYTEDNAATTTVTKALPDSIPKNWGADTQYAIAYSEQGTAVSQHDPSPLKKKEMEILAAKPGGKHDPPAIESRRLGELLTAILQDIASH